MLSNTVARSAILLATCAFFGSPAFAQEVSSEEEYELKAERLHSDLPLYTFDWEETWPRSFSSREDGVLSFGCTSPVAFGDWHFEPNPKDRFGETYWLRISNYGVLHCAANFRDAA